ncbi:hypothetical protein ACP70R_034796 [Stipagrostis hirtigluma subsp. patula]
MEEDLTRGAVAAVWEYGDGQLAQFAGLRPVLQVADLRQIDLPGRRRTGSTTKRYRMVLSDGAHSMQGLLATDNNRHVADGALRRGTVLRLLEYVCTTVHRRRFVIVIQFEILQTDCALIGDPQLYEYGQDVSIPSTPMRPAEKGPTNLTFAHFFGESHCHGEGMAAELFRKTIAQINDENLGCLDKKEFTVKAYISFINTENFCYAACPLVVDGRQCCMMVTSNGDGWWHCHKCSQTFVTCDYRYMISVQLQDSTGKTYASASQEAGEDIFGCTAKELYLMKYEKKDYAQFDSIVKGILFREYLFKLKLEEAFCDKKLPKCSIIKAEKMNPSTESHCLLREIDMLLQENSSSSLGRPTSMGTKTGFSYSEARLMAQNSRTDYGMNIGGARYLVSQSDSNCQ